ncbi:MAG: site-specific integrase [Bacillota bacterium]
MCKTTPKTSRSRRTIYLCQTALAALRKHRVRQAEERLKAGEAWQDWGLVFTTEIGTPLSPSNVRNRSFHKILKKANLPRIRFHDLRHTCATLLLAQGVHPKLVQEQLGHSEISVTLDLYSHVTAPMMKETAVKMDQILTATTPAREQLS